MQIVHDSTIELQNSRKYDWTDKSIDVQIFEDFESISIMRQDWDIFIEGIKGEIFLSYDWCQLWWKYYGKGRDLKIFIFRLGGKIVGILPIFKEIIWLGPLRTHVIKIVGTDFTVVTISVPIQKEFLEQVMRLFIHKLNEEWKWDILHIGTICGMYDSFDSLSIAINGICSDSFNVFINSSDVQTYFHLAGSLDEQIAGLNKKQRENMRRAYRIAENQGTLTVTLASEENISEYFKKFVQLHQHQWDIIGKPGHFRDWPYSYEFHRDFAQRQLKHGRLRLFRIAINDKCIGYKYGFKFGHMYHQFLSGRNEENKFSQIDFNKISFGEQVRWATTVDDVTMIDSMRGNYEHKIHLGGKLMPLRSIDIYPKKLLTTIKITLFRYISMLIDICYLKIWRRRLQARLKFKSAPLWNKWIRTNRLLY